MDKVALHIWALNTTMKVSHENTVLTWEYQYNRAIVVDTFKIYRTQWNSQTCTNLVSLEKWLVTKEVMSGSLSVLVMLPGRPKK